MKIFMMATIDCRISDASIIHFGEIANSLRKLGHELTLLLPGSYHHNQVIDKDIKIIDLPFFYKESIINAFLYGLLQFFWVLLKTPECDMFLIRWRFFPAFLFKLGYLFRVKKPIFITEHNGWIESEMKVQKRSLYSLGKFLQLMDAKSADKIIVVTNGIKKLLIKNGISEDKIFVVDNGTNTTKFYPLENRNILKQDLLNTNLPVLGFIGNISRWQGLDDLIDNFIEIKKHMEFILVIIGSGIYKNDLVSKVKALNMTDEIVFLDNVSYSEINKYINLIDYAVAPKIKDLDSIGYSPLKIRDYCACGKAVISTNVKGIQELEGHGWLWTYDPDVKDSFINLFLKMLNDYKLDEIKVNARKFALENFSWDIRARKIIEIFNA